MIFDGEVDIFSINDHELSVISLEKGRIFLILKLTFSILHNNLLDNTNVSFQNF